jgi:trk system potassium uptake protein TrkH
LVVAMWTAMMFAALLRRFGFVLYRRYFETASGLSTTGATVLVGLDALPASINLWRHLLNWLGGMGIIVLAVAILSMLGIGGRQLFKAETPGPMKTR